MAKYIVSGKIKLKEMRTFAKEIEAPSENAAKNIVYGLFGSQNKLIRSKIIIEKVEVAK